MEDSDVVIPPGDVEGAKKGLLGHARMLQGAAMWLEDNGYHAAAVYFSVLCMEEISRRHVLSACEGGGRGVTRADLSDAHDHRAKLSGFLGGAMPAGRQAGQPPDKRDAGIPEREAMADALIGAKERALYFDFGGGSMKTLEAQLGAEGTERASGLLRTVVEHGISAMQPHGAPAGARDGAGRDPQADVRPALARLVATVGMSGGGTARRGDPLIPRSHLDTALFCLEDHIGDLAKITHELHAGGKEAASVFMGVMTIEEGSKYYLMAQCRREGRGVTRKDMREMRNHKGKLAAFLKHAARALGDANVDRDTGEYRILDPGALKTLHDSKKLAIHFAHMAGEAITLDAIFGACLTNLADYVNETAQWIISWMVMNDGDAGNPYARHNLNPFHLERYERFGRFIEDPRNVAQYHGWIKMTGLLKRLNEAAQNHDVAGSRYALAAIREYGMWDYDGAPGSGCPT